MNTTELWILSIGLLLLLIVLVFGGRWYFKRKTKEYEPKPKSVTEEQDIKNVAKQYLSEHNVKNATIIEYKVMNAPIKTKFGHDIQILYFKYKLLKDESIHEELVRVEFINTKSVDKQNKRKVKRFERKILEVTENREEYFAKARTL